jgi:hypothetical protein
MQLRNRSPPFEPLESECGAAVVRMEKAFPLVLPGLFSNPAGIKGTILRIAAVQTRQEVEP